LPECFSGQIDIGDAHATFEGLTYAIRDVTRSDAQALHDMVNDIEVIQFGRLPENQPQAVCDVLVKAEAIFARYR
jgi:hypothetical protein